MPFAQLCLGLITYCFHYELTSKYTLELCLIQQTQYQIVYIGTVLRETKYQVQLLWIINHSIMSTLAIKFNQYASTVIIQFA